MLIHQTWNQEKQKGPTHFTAKVYPITFRKTANGRNPSCSVTVTDRNSDDAKPNRCPFLLRMDVLLSRRLSLLAMPEASNRLNIDDESINHRHEALMLGMRLHVRSCSWTSDDKKTIEPIKVYCDNRLACKTVQSGGNFQQAKHYRVRINFVKDFIDRSIVQVLEIGTKTMLADGLSKLMPLERIRFLYFISGRYLNCEGVFEFPAYSIQMRPWVHYIACSSFATHTARDRDAAWSNLLQYHSIRTLPHSSNWTRFLVRKPISFNLMIKIVNALKFFINCLVLQIISSFAKIFKYNYWATIIW